MVTLSTAIADLQARWHTLPDAERARTVRPTIRPGLSMTIFSAVADLQAEWHTLRDFERAEAILPIIRAGVSRRNLANALNTSEGTIRGLLSVLEADPVDQDLFRRGEISRNELLRRLRSGPPSRNGSQQKPEQKTRKHDSANACKHDPTNVCRLVLDWLREDPARSFNARHILGQASDEVAKAAKANKLPRDRAPIDMPADEIIRRCCPDPDLFDLDVNWYATWTGLWVFYLIPDPDLCRNALNEALNRVLAYERSPELW
jgi:hypothetical protein